MAEGRSFRGIDGLSRELRALLAVGIVVDDVNIVVTFLETQTLERFRSGLTDLHEVNDAFDRSRVVGIVVTICYLSTIVIWLVWQHRGQSNLHALAIPRLTFSPGWAVGWWLIPIANLWKPFQTVRELWKASGGDEAWWGSEPGRRSDGGGGAGWRSTSSTTPPSASPGRKQRP